MRFELYKIFRRKSVLVLLVAGLLLGVFSIISSALSYTVYDKDMQRLTGIEAIRYDRELLDQHARHYTINEMAAISETIDLIYNNPEYQTEKNSGFSAGNLNTTPLADEAYWKYLREYTSVSSAMHRTDDIKWYINDLEEYGDLTYVYAGTISKLPSDDVLIPPADVNNPKVLKLIEMYRQIELPIYGEYNEGWDRFWQSSTLIFQWIVGLIIIVGIAPVFSEERSTGADRILLTTMHGKSKMIRNKIVASMLFTSIIFLLYVFVLISLHIVFYGTSGLNAGIQTMPGFYKSPYNYTIASILLQYILIGWLSSMQHGAVVLFISALSYNSFIDFIPSMIVYVLPVFHYAELSP